MMKITIIAVSGLKEKYLREAAGEYIKRLGAFCDLTVIELEPARLPEKPSASEIRAALDREGKLILKKIPPGNIVAALCIEGGSLSSEDFAGFIKSNSDSGLGVTFIIGGSYGLSDDVKQRADKKISFSALTFPHRLFRIMLLEQIYRAFRINTGSTYQK